MRIIRMPSPATAIALVALFFALGGSAFALGQKTAAAQPRCAQGAVRGVAVVTGAAAIPDRYVATPSLFARKFNCTGKGILVKRVLPGIYDVRFVGNASNAAVASAATQTSAAVTRNQDGSFRVTVFTPEDNDHQQLTGDGAFQLVAV